jgi:hypothetical protein
LTTNDEQPQVEDIISFDNGDWNSSKYVHYCLVGHCRHGCTGPETALETAKATCRKLLGNGMATAEVYRWKGVEEANTYYCAARAQHEIFSNALKMQWDRKACDKAIAEVQDAANAELLAYTTLNSAKAGLILRDMDKDKNNETSVRLTLLTWPVQRFLNATFQADHLACDFLNKQAMDPTGAESQEARSKLFKANIAFFNGSRGEKVLSDYMGMVMDLNGTAWDGWNGSDADKLQCAKKLVVPMVGAWRRLVVPYTFNDAFELMVSSGDGVEIFDAAKLKSLGERLRAKIAVCEDCGDTDFTGELLPLITSDPELAHKICGDNIVMLRVGSGVVERQHILGQDLKPAKSKGVALDAQALAMTTYRKSVIAEGKWLAGKVKEKVLRDKKVGPEAMARHAKSFRFGKASYQDKSRTKKLRLLGGQKRVGLQRRSDGHKKFRRSVWSCKARVGTAEFVNEEKRVSLLWSEKSPEEKALWEAEGKLENESLLTLPLDATMDDVNVAVTKAGNASRGREMSLRRETIGSALEAMHTDPVWGNGLGLGSMASALKPEFVTKDSIKTSRAIVKDAFGHDYTVIPNPAVNTTPRLPCAIKNWGLCSQDPLLLASSRGTLNMYRQLKNNNISRDKLPIFAKLFVSGESVHVAIADTVGAGETLTVAFAECDENESVWSLKVQSDGGPRCAFSQQVIHELLHRAAAKINTSPLKYVSVDMALLVDPIPFSSGGRLAFRPPAGKELLQCKVPLDSAIPLGRSKGSGDDGKGGNATKMPFGLLNQAFSNTLPTKAEKVSGGSSGCKPKETADSGCHPDEEDVDVGAGGAGGGSGGGGGHAGGAGSADKEAAEKDAEEDVGLGPELPVDSDVWDCMPSGSKVGIMAIDLAPGHTAKCWLCVRRGHEKKACTVRKGSIRLWYRFKEGQAEKSMHLSCVTDGSFKGTLEADVSDLHLRHSMFFLRRHMHSDSFTDDLKEAMVSALAAVTLLASED